MKATKKTKKIYLVLITFDNTDPLTILFKKKRDADEYLSNLKKNASIDDAFHHFNHMSIEELELN